MLSRNARYLGGDIGLVEEEVLRNRGAQAKLARADPQHPARVFGEQVEASEAIVASEHPAMERLAADHRQLAREVAEIRERAPNAQQIQEWTAAQQQLLQTLVQIREWMGAQQAAAADVRLQLRDFAPQLASQVSAHLEERLACRALPVNINASPRRGDEHQRITTTVRPGHAGDRAILRDQTLLISSYLRAKLGELSADEPRWKPVYTGLLPLFGRRLKAMKEEELRGGPLPTVGQLARVQPRYVLADRGLMERCWAQLWRGKIAPALRSRGVSITTDSPGGQRRMTEWLADGASPGPSAQ